MPKYDVECQKCKETHVEQMSYEQYDMNVKGFNEFCETCTKDTLHKIVLKSAPGVEWRTDGATKVDWADPHTKYQREHFQESGDRSEKKRVEQRKRRQGK